MDGWTDGFKVLTVKVFSEKDININSLINLKILNEQKQQEVLLILFVFQVLQYMTNVTLIPQHL